MHVLVFPINVLHLYSCFQSSCEIFLKFLPKGKKLSISNTEKEEEEKKKTNILLWGSVSVFQIYQEIS